MGELRRYDRLKQSMERMEELKRQFILPWQDEPLQRAASAYGAAASATPG